MDYVGEKEKIVEELLKSRKVIPGASIDYAQFLELYAPYKDRMREKEFAEILEIGYDNYQAMKSKRNKSKSIKEHDKKSGRRSGRNNHRRNIKKNEPRTVNRYYPI